MDPQIISSYDGGKHNGNLDNTISRLTKQAAYKAIIIVPAFATISTRIVASWLNMYNPPNQFGGDERFDRDQ
jgi:hypothetical protein